jgi:hypothetical protein
MEIFYGTWGRRERRGELQSINNIVKQNIFENRGYKDMY